MALPIPPAFVLATLLILLGTQLAYLAGPRRPHYLIRLGLSTIAVLLGEALGAVGVGGRLALGELHPLSDLAVLVVLQWAGGRWIQREQPV